METRLEIPGGKLRRRVVIAAVLFVLGTYAEDQAENYAGTR
jgi:hypothetical protein